MRVCHGSRAAAVLLCAAAAVFGSTASPAASAAPGGMLWGAYPAARAGEDDTSATRRFESDAGRRLAVVRDFLLWDQAADPDLLAYHRWLVSTGHIPILSVRAIRTDGTVVPWADIAAARPGSQLYATMVAWADRLKSLGGTDYFAFNHEPESAVNQPMGTPSDFVAAWRKFHKVFAVRGATNVRFMWIMTDFSFWAASSDRRYAPRWYPGDAYVDALGEDAYNWFTCRAEYQSPWKSLEQIVTPFRDFGRRHPTKPLWLAEWASVEDPGVPGRKATWITDAEALFKRPDFSQFAGVSYFDSYKRAGCAWPVESSTSSQAAFDAMGADPFYAGAGTTAAAAHAP